MGMYIFFRDYGAVTKLGSQALYDGAVEMRV